MRPGARGSLLLDDFTCLRRSTAGSRRMKTVVNARGYGRKESITSLVQTIRGSAAAVPPVSAHEARNTQRVLDALLSSEGEWVNVVYE